MAEHIRSIQELDLSVERELYPSPPDWRDEIIYFLLVDRFNDGVERPLYNGVRGVVPDRPDAGVPFQGGTLKGVTERLSYVRTLGATTLWLSPIFKNRPEPSGSFHGYAIQDFLEIDPRLGTKEDLRELVRQAHQMDMYVILDIVINHTGDNWAYKDDTYPTYRHDGTQFEFGYWRAEHLEGEYGPDDAVWPAELQSSDCYKRRGGIVNWNDTEESMHGDFFNLKELDMKNGVVRETMQAVYKYWIKEADIDGYRIDTVKHVEHDAMLAFCTAIKEYAASTGKHNFFLYGEVVAGDDMVREYVGPRVVNGEKLLALDAALDFPLYFFLEEVIKGFVGPHLLRERYERLNALYPTSDASEYYVTFVDNHDQMVRPCRRFLHGGADPRQAVLALAYLFTSPGVPAIYYGTEQAFDGGAPPGTPPSDVYIRECMFGGTWGAFGTTGMHFFDTEHPVFRAIAAVAHLRAEIPALRYGRFYFREVSDDGRSFAHAAVGWGYLAYTRMLDSTEVVVVLNLNVQPKTQFVTVDGTITVPGTLLVDLLDEGYTVLAEERAGRAVAQVSIPGYGIRILAKKPDDPGRA